MPIVYLWPHDLNERNRARYQRAKYLSCQEDLILVNKYKSEIDQPLSEKASRTHTSFGVPGLTYVNYAIYYIFAFLVLCRLTYQYNKITIHTFPGPDLHLGFLFSRLNCVKWVADIVDDPALELESLEAKRPLAKYIIYRLHVRLCKLDIQAANLVIIQGMSAERGLPAYVSKNYNIKSAKIQAIPNGVDYDSTRRQSANPIQQRQKVEVFYLGSMKRSRNITEIIEAVGQVRSDGIDVQLKLLGPVRTEEDYYAISRSISEQKISEYVDFTGNRIPHAEALEEMSKADVCIINLSKSISQYKYAHPIKMFEYMCMGKPIVAIGLPGIREVLSHNFNSLLVDHGNAGEFADAITRIVNNPSTASQLGDNAQKCAQWFDWDYIHKSRLLSYPSDCMN